MAINCADCGTPRAYIGVSTPARWLCPCEQPGRKCSECGGPAAICEFQQSVKKGEPSLPRGTGNDVVSFFCDACPPAGFTLERPKKASSKSVVRREAVQALAAPASDRPVSRWRLAPTYDPESKLHVECFHCGHKHLLKDRIPTPNISKNMSWCPNGACESFNIKGYNEPIDANPNWKPPAPVKPQPRFVGTKEKKNGK